MKQFVGKREKLKVERKEEGRDSGEMREYLGDQSFYKAVSRSKRASKHRDEAHDETECRWPRYFNSGTGSQRTGMRRGKKGKQ